MFDNLMHGDFLHIFIEHIIHTYIYICSTYTHILYIYIHVYIHPINILKSAKYSKNSIEKFMNEF